MVLLRKNFWKTQEYIPHYFFFQILFDTLIKGELAGYQCPIIDDTKPHLLVASLDKPYNETEYQNIQKRLEEQKTEVQKLNEKFALEFKNLANEIFEEKSKKFTDQNKTNIGELLNPLKERIGEFQKKVEDTNKESLEKNKKQQFIRRFKRSYS